MLLNTLMLEGVATLLSPLHQGFLRSAGSLGYDAFEELVALQIVPVCGEVSAKGDGKVIVSTTTTIADDNNNTTVVSSSISRCCCGRGVDVEHAPASDRTSATLYSTFAEKGSYAREVGVVVVVYLRAISLDDYQLPILFKKYPIDGPPVRVELDSFKTVLPESLFHNSEVRDLTVNFDRVEELNVNCFSCCSNLEKLMITGGDGGGEVWRGHASLTTIPDGFLTHCGKLLSFNPSMFKTVTSIQNDFLSASGITTINLSPLSNVTVIGRGFMESCRGLTSLDMSPLTKVTSIGHSMLQFSSNLETVTFPSYLGGPPQSSPLMVVGNSYLSGCTQLKSTPDAAYLSNLTTIPFFFIAYSGVSSCGGCLTKMQHVLHINPGMFYQCLKLKSVDLSSLGNVTKIESDFLAGCKALQSIDMSPMVSLMSIGFSCLAKCTSLQKVLLPLLLPNSTIGDNFMAKCTNIKILDVTPLREVVSIGRRFLSGTGLSAADLSPFVHCTFGGELLSGSKVVSAVPPRHHGSVSPEGLLTQCRSLTSVDLSHLCPHSDSDDADVPVMNVINNEFLSWCRCLQTVDLSPLRHVTTILKEFMFNCEGLVSIDLSPLSNVTELGYRFMCSCRSLTSIDLRPLTNVKRIGTYFFGYAKKIQSLDLSPLRGLESIGIYPFYNCGGLISKEVANFLIANPNVKYLDQRGNPISAKSR